jgi:thioredoxin 1
LTIVIAPKFDELSDKYPDAVFLKVSMIFLSILVISFFSFTHFHIFNWKNIQVIGDASPDASKLMKREGVRSVPSFHYFKNGEKVDVVNGANAEAIEAAITKNL